MSLAHPQPEASSFSGVILLTDALRNLPLTGIGRYVLTLAQALPACPGSHDVRFFAGRDWVERPWASFAPQPGSDRQSSGAPGLTPGPTAGPGLLRQIRERLPWRCQQDRISFSAKKVSFWCKTRNMARHVLHAPNYLLLPHDGPSLATIHDLSFVHYPDYHPRERIALLERELPKTLRQADYILTDSEFVRQEIIHILGVGAERVGVTHLGVDACFHPRGPKQTTTVLRNLHLEHGGYLLSLATLEPRKNLPRLVRAYARLPRKLGQAYPLVLAGAGGWLTRDLESLIHPLERSGRLCRLGYVPEQDLPFLLAGAAGLALPSFYEGFGLPVLEAMASAVPVLTSNRSSLPEVAGDAALLADPEDEDAILLGLERLLTDRDFQEMARERGPQQAARFSWSACIQKTMAAYARVAAEKT